jgi:hypothetical protein
VTYGGMIRRGPMAADVLEKQFVQISNALARDKRLSFKAKGIFMLIASHRDGYGISEESIAAMSTDGLTAVRTGLKELINHGYLLRERQRNERGQLGSSNYFITDMPGGFQLDIPAPQGAADDKAGQEASSEPGCENHNQAAGEQLATSGPGCDFPKQADPNLGEPPEGFDPLKKTEGKNTNETEHQPPSLTSRTQVQSAALANGGGEAGEAMSPAQSNTRPPAAVPAPRQAAPVSDAARSVAQAVVTIAVGRGEYVGPQGVAHLAERAQHALDLGMTASEVEAWVSGGYDEPGRQATSVFAVASSRLKNLAGLPLIGSAPTHAHTPAAPAAAAVPEWCGECSVFDRTIEVPAPEDASSVTVIAHCPHCHPKAARTLEPAF